MANVGNKSDQCPHHIISQRVATSLSLATHSQHTEENCKRTVLLLMCIYNIHKMLQSIAFMLCTGKMLLLPLYDSCYS